MVIGDPNTGKYRISQNIDSWLFKVSRLSYLISSHIGQMYLQQLLHTGLCMIRYMPLSSTRFVNSLKAELRSDSSLCSQPLTQCPIHGRKSIKNLLNRRQESSCLIPHETPCSAHTWVVLDEVSEVSKNCIWK